MKKQNDLFIILLNYNSAEDTIECINSIKEKEQKVKYTIVVVDNFSTDDSLSKLRKIENIVLIESDKNEGFAAGNNLGIKYAINNGAKYILLLNNDTIIEENAISNQLEAFKHNEKIGIMGSRIMYYYNRDLINYCGGNINWFRGNTKHCRLKKKFDESIPKVEYTDFITGCSMLIKKEVIEKVGYLPEEYFMYYEDLDYCIQTKDKGYKLAVATDSVIYHKVSASSGGDASPFSIKWMTRNRIVFINKYKSRTKGMLTISFFYLTRIIKLLLYYIKGEKQKTKAIINGIKEGRKATKKCMEDKLG